MQIAKEQKLPVTAFASWMLREKNDVIERARELVVDDLVCELLPEMKNALRKPKTAPAFKVKFEAAMKMASKWDPARYGDRVKAESGGLADATAFLEAATNLLKDIKRPALPEPKVIEGESVSL